MPAQRAPVISLALVLVTAGCTGAPFGGSTPLPPGTVDFPDGPMEPPERPSDLTASSVREYVRTYEYRAVFNQLWLNEYTEVTLDCGVEAFAKRSWGFEAVVTCTAYSNTRPPEDATATPGPYYDHFTQSSRYRVSETTTRRSDAGNRESVG